MNRNGIGRDMVMQIYSKYPILVDLMKLKEDSRLPSAMEDQIMILEQGLQFLVIYKLLLKLFHRKISRINAIVIREGILNVGVLALDTGEFKDWDALASELLTEINSYKPSVREDCSIFSEGLYIKNFFHADYFPKIMMYTDISMSNILQLKGDLMNPDEKMKFESSKKKLDMFRIVYDYVKKSNTSYEDFLYALNAWVWNAAYLCLFYWVVDENMIHDEKNVMLSKFYENFDFSHPKWRKIFLRYFKSNNIPVEERCKVVGDFVSPDVTKMCLSYLKTIKPSLDKRHEAFVIGIEFIEYLQQNLRKYLPEDAIEMLCDTMVILIAFVMDPPFKETEKGRLVLNQTQEALKEAGTRIISLGSWEKDEAGIVEATNFLLHDFNEMVITIKEEVRKSFSHLFLDPSFNLPWITVLNLFACSIENLKEFRSLFSKHPFFVIEKGLVALRELLEPLKLNDKFLLELHNEHKELKDLWNQISYVAYQADRITRSYIYHHDGLMIILHDVNIEINCILAKVKRFKFNHEQDSYTSGTKINSDPIAQLEFDVEEIDEVVVGFESKAQELQYWLIHGSEKLNIISITGMAGLGKTTLAKKVYNDPVVKRQFATCAWCIVSESYDTKKLLLDILKDVTEVNDNVKEMEEEDLAATLKRSLMGKRYLIVMDDIWNVCVWNKLKLSFPDNENYSRILFTSRIHNVVRDAKLDSFPYHLSPLTDTESWELLERKLFNGKDICPRKFVEYGKQIAIDCKGLPLAIVLAVGLIKKEIYNLDWWKQIGKNLNSKISEEGCAHILELSYKHLSEPLKVCFLYLGIFQEDKVIKVQKLVHLWVSEGFIAKKGMKDVEIVAKEYVMDLIDRSMLIVSNRSSNGGIKACRIHDLLREFCLAKSEEESFFKLLHGKKVSLHAMDDEYYRISIHTQYWKQFLVKKSSPLYSIRISPTGTSNAFNISPNSFCNARFLHVLDLEEAKFIGDFPEEITTLIFLKYLAIWCTTKFIPVTIARLENLETLRVIKREPIILPAEISQMKSLRHVHIGNFFFPYLLLPMENICSFSSPCLTYGKETETLLSKFPTIQKLKCEFRSHQQSQVIKRISGGSFKLHQDELIERQVSRYQQKQVIKLDFLNQLESLNMTHEGRPWLRSFKFCLPANIKKLTLSNFGLPWREISRIAKLPNLEVLKLLVDAFVGRFWNMDSMEFKRLKFLKLQGLNVKKWSASDKNFPCLEQIVVERCYKLEKIPIELVNLLYLQKIHVRRCCSSVVDSAEEIQCQQIDTGNLNFKIETVQILSEKLHG